MKQKSKMLVASKLNSNGKRAQLFAIFSTSLKPIANQTGIQARAGDLERTEAIYKTFPKSFSLPKAMLFLIPRKDRRILQNADF